MNHSINDLFKISMDSLQNMIDVNTVVGDIKNINEDINVIPISKVKCSYVTGGLEYNKSKEYEESKKTPFGGASGGMLAITPVAFLVVSKGEISVLHLDNTTHLYEKIIDSGLDIISEIKKMFNKTENKINLD